MLLSNASFQVSQTSNNICLRTYLFFYKFTFWLTSYRSTFWFTSALSEQGRRKAEQGEDTVEMGDQPCKSSKFRSGNTCHSKLPF